jgi:hypothetical protein
MIKKKKNSISVKTQLYIATGIVLLLVAFGAVVGWMDASMTPKKTTPDAYTLQDITLKGELTCLGHKGSGPSTMECGIGIKLPSGSIYSLAGKGVANLGTSGATEVTGTLTIPSYGQYASDGTLTIK